MATKNKNPIKFYGGIYRAMQYNVIFNNQSGNITPDTYVNICDATDGNLALTLPQIYTNDNGNITDITGVVIKIKRRDASINTITVSPAGTDLIEGGSSVNIPTGVATTFVATTTPEQTYTWYLI